MSSSAERLANDIEEILDWESIDLMAYPEESIKALEILRDRIIKAKEIR